MSFNSSQPSRIHRTFGHDTCGKSLKVSLPIHGSKAQGPGSCKTLYKWQGFLARLSVTSKCSCVSQSNMQPTWQSNIGWLQVENWLVQKQKQNLCEKKLCLWPETSLIVASLTSLTKTGARHAAKFRFTSWMACRFTWGLGETRFPSSLHWAQVQISA